MQHQTKYSVIYVTLLFVLLGSVLNFVYAQDPESGDDLQPIALDQAEVDQILAPIALYPDTLLSHILVASTYPLEVVQAARWRSANEDLNEQQTLDAVEDKDWDPSVKALTPFNDLLQKLSEDLNWLQNLGSAFLVNEQQLLESVQNLRQKAYQTGNLRDNQYVQVERQENQIVIETVRKEIIYVPYYDTRVVYGNWWWDHHQPYIWRTPRHALFSAGFYWSTGFTIRPSFYFGGFHWHNRHVVANYHYRTHANRHWSNNHDRRQRVRVTEYPRWSHNSQHRRGAQYRLSGKNLVLKNNVYKTNNKYYQQVDKKRVLKPTNSKKIYRSNANNVKQKLKVQSTQKQSRTVKNTNKLYKGLADKQKVIQQGSQKAKQKEVRNYTLNKTQQMAKSEPSQRAPNKTVSKVKSNKQYNKTNTKSRQTSPSRHNKQRDIRVVRSNQSQRKQK